MDKCGPFQESGREEEREEREETESGLAVGEGHSWPFLLSIDNPPMKNRTKIREAVVQLDERFGGPIIRRDGTEPLRVAA